MANFHNEFDQQEELTIMATLVQDTYRLLNMSFDRNEIAYENLRKLSVDCNMVYLLGKIHFKYNLKSLECKKIPFLRIIHANHELEIICEMIDCMICDKFNDIIEYKKNKNKNHTPDALMDKYLSAKMELRKAGFPADMINMAESLFLKQDDDNAFYGPEGV